MSGTGSIGRLHIANLRDLRPNAAFALLRREARPDDYSLEIGAQVFAELSDAIAWQPDLAVIATPSDAHADSITPLLDAGIPCLIEKPVVIDKCDAASLAARLPSDTPATQVGCVLRFMEAFEIFRSWVVGGRLGTPIRATIQCGQDLRDWRPGTDYRDSYSADASRGGGVIFDLVHEIDLAVALFGACTLKHVSAGKLSTLELACEDVAQLTLSSPAGMPISIGLDYVSHRPVRTIEIIGEAGNARIDFIAGEAVLDLRGGERVTITKGFSAAEAYRKEITELLVAIETGSETRIPLAEGLKATFIAIEAHTRARKLLGQCA